MQKLANAQGGLVAFPYMGDLLSYLTGWQIPLPLPTFGFFLAMALLASYSVFAREVWWREESGVISIYKDETRLSELVQDFSFVTIFSGIAGARLFHILEYPTEFMADPWGMIFSRGGFTVIGGLLFGALAGVRFVKKRKFEILPSLDSASPAMMIGYAVGRIGCQLSGDGDWGIIADLSLKPNFIPDWLWAQQYKGNVIGELLPAPGVYPTPLYESVISFFLLAILLLLSKRLMTPGRLFSVYLIVSGLERFFIEKIRVNSKYHLGDLQFTQAELLSVIMILSGVVLYFVFNRSNKSKNVAS